MQDNIIENNLKEAYVLHAIAYRETSLLLTLFIKQQGVVRVVAKGARSPRSKNKGLLQPFLRLYIELKGRHSLKTLTQVESFGRPYILSGKALYCGFYLNELLERLAVEDNAYNSMFNSYHIAIERLSSIDNNAYDFILRSFEWELLQNMGYGFDKLSIIDDDDAWYRYCPTDGLEQVSARESYAAPGKAIISLISGLWSSEIPNEYKKPLKQFMRAALRYYLGDKPLKSMSLWR